MRTIEVNAVAMAPELLEIDGQKKWVVWGLVDGNSVRVILNIGAAQERYVIKESAIEAPCA